MRLQLQNPKAVEGTKGKMSSIVDMLLLDMNNFKILDPTIVFTEDAVDHDLKL